MVINGVTWATRNVDMPGTFAASGTDAGMFYQWNRITAWSNTEPLKAYNTDGEEIVDEVWPSYNDFATSWLPANDPSPAGWRVPTKAGFLTLLDTEKVSTEWVAATETTPAGQKFTDIATGNSIFFHAGGTRSASSPNNGTLTRVGEAASWWSASNGTNNNQYKVSMRTIESIADITEGAVWGAYPYNGYFIRSVKVSE